MAIATLPNPELLRHLANRYYRPDGPPLDDGPQISSHWRHYGQQCEVRLDASGDVVVLSGSGFGSYRFGGPLEALLHIACLVAHLAHVPHRAAIVAHAALAWGVCRRLGLDPTVDAFRQVCTLALLLRHVPAERAARLNAVMIGDGYGLLGILLKKAVPQSTVVMVDIGRTLVFQAYYCQRACPDCSHALAADVTRFDDADFVYCPAEHLSRIEGLPVDLAVNVASMQEMAPEIVAGYFAFLRRNARPRNLFYCCNRESKTLLGGEVAEFLRYPWRDDDLHVVDGLCPWHQYFFSRARTRRGISAFGKRVPFVNLYDGRHLHRLTVLAKT